MIDLLKISEDYNEEEIKSETINRMIAVMNVQNVCDLYSASLQYKLSRLEVKCFDFMSKHIKDIITTDGYKQMDANIAKQFFTKYHKN